MIEISCYTTTLNDIFWFGTIRETILSGLEFADEFVVVDGYSEDRTIELIEELQANDSRIKLYFFKDRYDLGQGSYAAKKTFALKMTRGRWAVLMDSDEVFHEAYAQRFRRFLLNNDLDGVRLFTLHFYRSWNKIQIGKEWYRQKLYAVNKKRWKDVEHGRVGTDVDNFVIGEEPFESHGRRIAQFPAYMFHYGWCRPDHVLLLKKWRQEINFWGSDYWKTHKFPFKFDTRNLVKHSHSHPKWMKQKIQEKWRWIHEFDDSYEGIFK